MILDSILLCVSTPADQTIDLALRISLTVLQGGLLIGMIAMVVAMFNCIHSIIANEHVEYLEYCKDKSSRYDTNLQTYRNATKKAQLETFTMVLFIMLVMHIIASVIFFNKSGYLSL